MRQPAYIVALAATLAFAGCGKKAPETQPVAPVAPTPPPTAPPPPEVAAPVEDEYSRIKKMSTDEIDRMGLLADIHFEFDRADIRAGDRQILSKNADVLKKFDFLRITVEGHCDERGSVEYNINLGDRRARAAQDYLVSLGVPADRLKVVSYGKESPLCGEHTEECWTRNRRAHFAVTGKSQ